MTIMAKRKSQDPRLWKIGQTCWKYNSALTWSGRQYFIDRRRETAAWSPGPKYWIRIGNEFLSIKDSLGEARRAIEAYDDKEAHEARTRTT